MLIVTANQGRTHLHVTQDISKMDVAAKV